MKYAIYFYLSLCNYSFGASLKSTADRLGQEATKIGVALGILALAIAGTMLALGKQEGGERVTKAIMGLVVVLSASTLIKTISSVVG
ncbi:MAG: TrbC/VirB2 family protein [Bacteriovoracaceae bacterium]